MSHEPKHDITGLLKEWGQGDREALDALLPHVYAELSRLARRHLQRERPNHTLETGALVHEAYERLIGQRHVEWADRAHFYAIAAQTMRRILVDHARARAAEKRGLDVPKESLEQVEASDENAQPSTDWLAVDEAVRKLAELDPQKAKLVDLRFFGGLTNEEVAEVLQLSLSTVEREWRMARAFLYRFLEE